MLYQPSYPSPYLSDIDGKKVNEFSCYINADGGTKVTSYNYSISDLNGKNVYTSNIKTIQPIYANEVLSFEVPTSTMLNNGVDYTWSITLYEDNPDIWITYGSVQSGENTTTTVYLRPNYLIKTGMFLSINNQLIEIKSYNAESGIATLSSALARIPRVGEQYNIYSNNITSTEYFFRARTYPTLQLNEVPSVIDNKSYTFSANYSQQENVGYKYYKWTIYDRNGNIIDTTNEVNAGVIEYTFDGFINGNIYAIGLLVENQDGVVISISPKYFSVEYSLPELENAPSAIVNCNNTSIKVTWSPLLINRGEVEHGQFSQEPYYEIIKDQPYIGGSSVNINKDNKLYWNIGSKDSPIYAPYESTTFINWHTTDPNFEGVVYRQEGEYVNLKEFSQTPPATASVGDKYFNIADKLIYTAVATNIWGTKAEIPRDDVIYLLLTNNTKFLWENNDMTETLYDLPFYEISYRRGSFYYIIKNQDVYIQGSVVIETVEDKWLLQSKDTLDANNYIWKDGILWDDSLYWTETGTQYINSYWFKLTLLPNKLLVYKNKI